MLSLTPCCFLSLLVISSVLFLTAVCHCGCLHHLILSGGMVKQTCRLPRGFSGWLGARGRSPVLLMVLGRLWMLQHTRQSTSHTQQHRIFKQGKNRSYCHTLTPVKPISFPGLCYHPGWQRRLWNEATLRRSLRSARILIIHCIPHHSQAHIHSQTIRRTHPPLHGVLVECL